MDISIEQISAVDKDIILKADRKDLEPKFEKALRGYRKKMNLPGFRPGQVPMSVVRKRFGKEIEGEEINSFIQEVYTQKIVPEHKPVGEPKVNDFKWEDDQLEVTFRIGVKPEFELTDLEKLTIDKLVHDVTEDEVDKELESSLERGGEWIESEGFVLEKSRVTVDAMAIDDQGNPVEGDIDKDKELNMEFEDQPFRDALLGKKVGEIVPVELGEGDDKATYHLTIKKILNREKAELNEEFVKKATNGQVDSVEDYRSRLKSQIQNYYDESAENLLKQKLMDTLVDSHDIEVPEVSVDSALDFYVRRFREESGEKIPPDFNEEEYRKEMRDKAIRESKWSFILMKLEEKFPDIEITEKDIDSELSKQAARYGLTTEMVKGFYSQSGEQLENLRMTIRTEKLFNKLFEVISINELSKEAYNSKHS